MTEFSNDISPKVSYDKYKPPITILIFAISITLFVGINLEANLEDLYVYTKWGSPSAIELFGGSYWGLITSNFLHTELWHIGFNLYWIWIFGKKIEYESSKTQYLFLIISAALISSFAQLGFSDSTGIGLSGIGYAFFGFLVVKGRTNADYVGFLEKRTIHLFLIWLFVCVFLTQLEFWNVGNAAHIAGLIWGFSIAYISRFKSITKWAFGSILLVIIASSVLWNPFATSLLSYQAYTLHENQQIDEAIVMYEEILARDADNEFAKINLAQLEKATLYNKAFKLHSESEYAKARAVYNEILALDADDQWAKENLSRLPAE